VQLRKVIGSLTFRYIARYLLVLSVAVFLLLVVIYGLFSYNYFRQFSNTIVEELESLSIIYRGQSLPGVQQYVDDQMRSLSVDRFHYLVTNAEGNKVAGDLPAETGYREFDDGWLGFELAMLDWDGSVEADFFGREMALGDGHQVIVARDVVGAARAGRLVFTTLLRAMLATILLGLVGGYFAAARTLQRVDDLNREVSRILQGDPARRLEVADGKGHVGELAIMMNQMLEQTESLMHGVRRVSDNIAHDLRTPLTRMRNQLSQLRAGLPESAVEEVDQIIADCDGLLSSFNAVLRISTLEAGSRLSGGAEVDLCRIVEDAVELYEPVAQDKGVELSIRRAGGPAECRGEADLLFQMVANVLDNAIKYSPEGGSVDVTIAGSEKKDAPKQVIIADSGPGISAEYRDHVFRRFYRADSSRSGEPGHGLGLSLAQAIAHYHRGRIDLSDNNPGLAVAISLP